MKIMKVSRLIVKSFMMRMYIIHRVSCIDRSHIPAQPYYRT